MAFNLIKIPQFKDLPRTDTANVVENIDNWLERQALGNIATYLRLSHKGYRGYRFVTRDDLEESIEETQTILGVKLRILFVQTVHSPDHFCPLWFRPHQTIINIYWGKVLLNHRNDTQFRRLLKGLKDDPYQGDSDTLYSYECGKYVATKSVDDYNNKFSKII